MYFILPRNFIVNYFRRQSTKITKISLNHVIKVFDLIFSMIWCLWCFGGIILLINLRSYVLITVYVSFLKKNYFVTTIVLCNVPAPVVRRYIYTPLDNP